MKKLSLISIVCLAVSSLQAQNEIAPVKTFFTPGILKLSYPANFVVASGAENQAMIDYAKHFIDKANLATDVSFNQLAILLTASTQEQGEYAHLNVTIGPPEISQEELADADANGIAQLKNAMGMQIKEGLHKSGIELVADFTGTKEDLAGGIKCFTLGFSYKKSDGEIRINTKRYIYTKRHTIVIGITTSPGYSKAKSDELEMIKSSIIAFND